MAEQWPDWMYEVKPFSNKVSIDDVQKAVARVFDINHREMKSQSRRKSIAVPRQVAMTLSSTLTEASLPMVGKAFGGRDHTTVMHAHKATKRRMGEDTDFEQKVRKAKRLALELMAGGEDMDALVSLLMDEIRSAVAEKIKNDPCGVIKKILGEL